MSCPLCHTPNAGIAVKGPDKRAYWQCPCCWLIYVSQQHYPNLEDEKKRYEVHQNTIENEGYVQFLNQAITPTLSLLQTGNKGLDYGCGPHPTLSQLIKQHGFECDNYDPFFFPQAPQPPYDFIFATECIEHFFFPLRDFTQIKEWLKTGGYLTILTAMWQSHEQFANWSYARDFTHVCFYHTSTMDFIAKEMGFSIVMNDGKRVCVFKKMDKAYI